jgi:2'-5' RNA ligase
MHEYSSTHILLPNDLADEIYTWGEKNIPDADLFTDPSKPSFGREYEMHVTVLHGLHEGTPHEVRKLVEGIPEFEIELGNVSIFTTNDFYDVIKLDVRSEGLRNLNRKLSRLPHTRFFPIYKPHVTIAYVVKGKGNDVVGQTAFVKRCWKAASIVFSSKRGTKTNILFKPE